MSHPETLSSQQLTHSQMSSLPRETNQTSPWRRQRGRILRIHAARVRSDSSHGADWTSGSALTAETTTFQGETLGRTARCTKILSPSVSTSSPGTSLKILWLAACRFVSGSLRLPERGVYLDSLRRPDSRSRGLKLKWAETAVRHLLPTKRVARSNWRVSSRKPAPCASQCRSHRPGAAPRTCGRRLSSSSAARTTRSFFPRCHWSSETRYGSKRGRKVIKRRPPSMPCSTTKDAKQWPCASCKVPATG